MQCSPFSARSLTLFSFLVACLFISCMAEEYAIIFMERNSKSDAKEFAGILISPVCGLAPDHVELLTYGQEGEFKTQLERWRPKFIPENRVLLYITGAPWWKKNNETAGTQIPFHSIHETLKETKIGGIVLIFRTFPVAPLPSEVWSELVKLSSGHPNCLILADDAYRLDMIHLMGQSPDERGMVPWEAISRKIVEKGGFSSGNIAPDWLASDLSKKPDMSGIWMHINNGEMQFWWDGLRFYSSYLSYHENVLRNGLLSGSLAGDSIFYVWYNESGANGIGMARYQNGAFEGNWESADGEKGKISIKKVEDHPKDTRFIANYPSNGSSTLENKIFLAGNIKDSDIVSVTVNGQKAELRLLSKSAYKIWEYRISVRLRWGMNTLRVEALKENGERISRELKYNRSGPVPRISIKNHRNGEIVHQAKTEIQGEIFIQEELKQILFDQVQVPFLKVAPHRYTFNREIALKPGENKIVVRVFDPEGETRSRVFSLKYVPVDTLAPSIKLIQPEGIETGVNLTTGERSFEIKGEIEDNEEVLKYRIGEKNTEVGKVRKISFEERLILAEGEQRKIEIMAWDAIGNTRMIYFYVHRLPVIPRFDIVSIQLQDQKGQAKDSFTTHEAIFVFFKIDVREVGEKNHLVFSVFGNEINPAQSKIPQEARLGEYEFRLPVVLNPVQIKKYLAVLSVALDETSYTQSIDFEIVTPKDVGWFHESLPPGMRLGETKGEYLWARDESVMVYVPEGFFYQGSDDGAMDERPMKKVFLSPFYIDKNEVTNNMYRKFMASQGQKFPPFWNDEKFNHPRHPVIGVSWEDCLAYASWAGKSLPSESQWEKTARGGLLIPDWKAEGMPVPIVQNPFPQRIYPWGNERPGQAVYPCNFLAEGKDGYAYTSPVGIFSDWPSPYRCQDMAGNAWEWCMDDYEEEFYRRAPEKNPLNLLPGSSYKTLRGGSWFASGNELRLTFRYREMKNCTRNLFGFRTVFIPPEK